MLRNSNYVYFFGIAFILKLFLEIILGPGILISLGVLFFLLFSLLILFIIERGLRVKERAAPPDIQISSDIKEVDSLKDLERLLLEGGLELKLRRVDELWQVTLIRHDGSIIRIVGMGVAGTIVDSLIKAEVNFLEKE